MAAAKRRDQDLVQGDDLDAILNLLESDLLEQELEDDLLEAIKDVCITIEPTVPIFVIYLEQIYFF